MLEGIPKGQSLLDVGAGECPYKSSAGHLTYVSQDIAQYDGKGTGEGLQTGKWDFSRIDIVCDILDIPEDRLFDCVLCTEVLEHVPDPVAVLAKVARLVKPGGMLILTAPFASYTHFAPYHYATGFSRYFYEWHLPRFGFDISTIEPSAGFFELIGKETKRARRVLKKYLHTTATLFERLILLAATVVLRRWASRERALGGVPSSEFATRSWHVIAVRRSFPESRSTQLATNASVA